jgi:peroxiredoxin Q/BCP
MATPLKIGDRAPTFALPDQEGKTRSLEEFLGSWILLYFYPKDDTPGCTKEAREIRDHWPALRKAAVVVVGISPDPVRRHARFAEKYQLPFTLLSDVKKEIVETYGVWAKKKFMGREYMGTKRQSFLIDPEGRIVKIYENVKPAVHAEEVLEDIIVLEKI